MLSSWVNQLFRLGRGFNSELFVYQKVNDVNYGRFTGAKRREWRNGMIMNIYYGSFPHSLQPVRKYWKKNGSIIKSYLNYNWISSLFMACHWWNPKKKNFPEVLGYGLGQKKNSRKPTNICLGEGVAAKSLQILFLFVCVFCFFFLDVFFVLIGTIPESFSYIVFLVDFYIRLYWRMLQVDHGGVTIYIYTYG